MDGMDGVEWIDYLWEDRIRHLGLPLSFTRYRLSKDRIFFERGFFNTRVEEILLYRVQDLQLTSNLWQKLFHVGTVRVYSTDKSTPRLDLINIANPWAVKELIHRHVEEARLRRRMRVMEVMDAGEERRPEGVTLDIGEEDEEFPD